MRSRTWPPTIKRPVMVGVSVFFLWMLVPYIYRLVFGRPAGFSSPWFTYGILYPFGIWSLGSFFTFLFLILTAPIRWLSKKLLLSREAARPPTAGTTAEKPAFSRRMFLRWAVGGTTAAPLLLTTYGTVYARTAFETVEIDVPVRSLPEELIGFRIVQISDLHAGPFTPERQIVKFVVKANSLSPDLAVVTGDIVHSSKDYILPCMRALSGLRAKYGVFACQGNHEYWVGAEEVRQGVESIGIKMLINEGSVLSVGGRSLNLAALDDIRTGMPDLNKALAGLDPAAPTLLLSHRPEAFPHAARRGVDLTLSGHWHGGQVKVKVFGIPFSPIRLLTRYLEGAFQIGQSRLYVTRGLGTTGAPIRLGSRPELTLIRLTRA